MKDSKSIMRLLDKIKKMEADNNQAAKYFWHAAECYRILFENCQITDPKTLQSILSNTETVIKVMDGKIEGDEIDEFDPYGAENFRQKIIRDMKKVFNRRMATLERYREKAGKETSEEAIREVLKMEAVFKRTKK